jgi:hypothetical protein
MFMVRIGLWREMGWGGKGMWVILKRNWGQTIFYRGRQGFVGGLMHLKCGHKDTCEREKGA